MFYAQQSTQNKRFKMFLFASLRVQQRIDLAEQIINRKQERR